MSEYKSKVILHCGAAFDASEDPDTIKQHFRGIAVENKRDPEDMRIVTYDSEGGITEPKKDGKRVWCLWDCPCKRKSKRKEELMWPSVDDGKAPRRRVVSCRILRIEAANEIAALEAAQKEDV